MENGAKTSKEITLKLNNGAKKIIKNFSYTSIGRNQNLFIDLNGKYGDRTVVSNFSEKSWKATRDNLTDALKEKDVTPKDIVVILDVLDSNGRTILGSLDEDKEEEDVEQSEVLKKESTKILEFIEEHGLILDLFKNQFDAPFARVRIHDHCEILPIHKSLKFQRWICGTYFNATGKPVSESTLNEVCMNLASRAEFKGEKRDLQLRVNRDPDDELTYYYDLTNEPWEVIKITVDGWTIEQSDKVPIMFRRFSTQKAQVYPAKSRDYPDDIFDRFFNLLNVSKDEDTGLLLKCYLIALFIPEISKAILILFGPQGAAKSAMCQLIKSLVDPSPLEILKPPRDEDRLVQQLSHNYLAYFDNISLIRSWLSDAFCRAATGTADSKRALYTDDDDVLYQFIRCIGINGINLAANKADLLDRSIIAELLRIDPKNVRDFKGDIIPEFNGLKPQLLVYIFDTLVKVLRMKSEGGIYLESKSRMADFEVHAEMISRCMGYEPLQFIKAYRANKEIGSGQALESSPVAKALIEFMDDQNHWEGTFTELLSELESVAVRLKINMSKEKLWPKAANALSARLNEIKVDLAEVGITVDYIKDPRTRLKTIIIGKRSFGSSDRPQDEIHAQNGIKSADDDEKRSSAGNSASSANDQTSSANDPTSSAGSEEGGTVASDHSNSADDDFARSSADGKQNHAQVSSDITSDERSDDADDDLPTSFPEGSSEWLLDKRRGEE